jgi:hypothetical protein
MIIKNDRSELDKSFLFTCEFDGMFEGNGTYSGNVLKTNNPALLIYEFKA